MKKLRKAIGYSTVSTVKRRGTMYPHSADVALPHARIDIEKGVASIDRDTAWIAVLGTVSMENVYPIRVAGGLVREHGKLNRATLLCSIG